MATKTSYDTVFFDLDGTLTDPKEGITKSVAFALGFFGIEVKNLDDLCKFIGPPLAYSFREYYAMTQDDIKIAIQKYREYFSQKGIFQNAVYEGIDGLLANLRKAKKRLVVATSKPTVYAERILAKYDIRKYFSEVVGAELNGDRSEKSEVIHAALELSRANPTQTVMVGDRKYDIIGAKEHGLDSIGVLFGYGSYDELHEAGATYIAADIKELSDILI